MFKTTSNDEYITLKEYVENKKEDQKVIYYPELKQDPFNELISLIEGQDINVEASNTILRHPILKSIEESIQLRVRKKL